MYDYLMEPVPRMAMLLFALSFLTLLILVLAILMSAKHLRERVDNLEDEIGEIWAIVDPDNDSEIEDIRDEEGNPW